VAWSSLHFAGHKMGLDGSLTVQVSGGGVADPPAGTFALPATAVDPGPGEVVLESTTVLPGRSFFATERIDAGTAAARVVTSTETGARNHRKTWTLAAHGFLLHVREPANRSEIPLGPGGWTGESRMFTAYPLGLPAGDPVLGPAGLLYRVSTACMTRPGDSLVVRVLVQTAVEEVTVTVLGSERYETQFELARADRTTTVRGPIEVVRLGLRGRSLDPESEGVLRLFGLEGDIEILWDHEHGVPVEISGHVKLLGRLELQLASATVD
jgi:hypothetical protein